MGLLLNSALMSKFMRLSGRRLLAGIRLR